MYYLRWRSKTYEIHEHVEEVLDFWKGMLARADRIDMAELLAEKLGYPLPISYEDWITCNHYENIPAADTRWLYRQEQGYVESMKNITLCENVVTIRSAANAAAEAQMDALAAELVAK